MLGMRRKSFSSPRKRSRFSFTYASVALDMELSQKRDHYKSGGPHPEREPPALEAVKKLVYCNSGRVPKYHPAVCARVSRFLARSFLGASEFHVVAILIHSFLDLSSGFA